VYEYLILVKVCGRVIENKYMATFTQIQAAANAEAAAHPMSTLGTVPPLG